MIDADLNGHERPPCTVCISAICCAALVGLPGAHLPRRSSRAEISDCTPCLTAFSLARNPHLTLTTFGRRVSICLAEVW